MACAWSRSSATRSSPRGITHLSVANVRCLVVMIVTSRCILQVTSSTVRIASSVARQHGECCPLSVHHSYEALAVPSPASLQQLHHLACPHVQGTNSTVQLVDVPGHPRLRCSFNEWIRAAVAVVFVLDAGDFVRQRSVTAECVPGPAAAFAARSADGIMPCAAQRSCLASCSSERYRATPLL